MLNSNDSAKVVEHVANDLIKRKKSEIVGTMDRDSRISFLNGTRTLIEVCEEIERDIVAGDELLMLHSG